MSFDIFGPWAKFKNALCQRVEEWCFYITDRNDLPSRMSSIVWKMKIGICKETGVQINFRIFKNCRRLGFEPIYKTFESWVLDVKHQNCCLEPPNQERYLALSVLPRRQ